uniref:Uncharacterized protein n=1 Tax=Eutreptiella gymnastica TaxID=73025 RepID=A0A7S1JHJ2_9EUGL
MDISQPRGRVGGGSKGEDGAGRVWPVARSDPGQLLSRPPLVHLDPGQGILENSGSRREVGKGGGQVTPCDLAPILLLIAAAEMEAAMHASRMVMQHERWMCVDRAGCFRS